MSLRTCLETDAERVRAFVERCEPLTVHTPFTYWVTLRYWGSMCLVVEEEDAIVGYISTLGAADQVDLLYVWQIGVATSHRGHGLGRTLIDELITRARGRGYRRLQVSISPDNAPSRRLFEQAAASRETTLEVVAFGDEPTFEFAITPRVET